jgi:polar amino acid transport system substrate-binding protein
MKKIIAFVLAALMLCACLTACGNSKEETKAATLDSVKQAGKLTIATSPDFPPFEELNADGSVTGIEIEIMELICEKLGVELDIKQMDFDSVLPGVQAAKYDVGVSGISVTPAREKNVKFTTPYCLAAQAIVVLEGSEIQSKADLTGKKISVQSGTTAESFCLENNYEVSAFKANTDAQTAMVSGKVAAWVIDDLTAAEMVAAYNEANPTTKLVILDEAMTTEPYAFAFNMGSADLVNEINKILEELVTDGTVKKIFEEYKAPYTSPKQ